MAIMQACPCGGNLNYRTLKGTDYLQCSSCGRNNYQEMSQKNNAIHDLFSTFRNSVSTDL